MEGNNMQYFIHVEWTKKKDIVFKSILTIVLFVISLANIMKLYQPYVLGDEFGYWSNAAYLAGYDWTQMSVWMGYYAYGYSILLIPIIKLFGDSVLMYRAAVVLNAIMLCCSFHLACYCGNTWNKKKYTPQVPIAAFVTMFYPGSFVNVNVAWSETIQYMLFWMVAVLVVKCVAADVIKISTIGFMTALAGTSYFVHQRNIVLLLMEAVFIGYLLRYKRITSRYILCFVTVLALVLLSGLLMKSYITNRVYLSADSALYDANNISGQMGKLQFLLTDIQGIKYLLLNILGRLTYFMVSTFGICALVLCFVIRNLKEYYRNNPDVLFIVLCFLGSIAVSSIFMLVPERYDTLFYGRYSEQYIGPVLFWGLYKIFHARKPLAFNTLMMVIGAMLVCSDFVIAMMPKELGAPIKIQFIGFIDYIDSGKLVLPKLIFSIKLILLSMVIVLLVRKKLRKISLSLMVLILSVFWHSKVQPMMELILWQQNLYYQITEIRESVQVCEIESEVYCVSNEHYYHDKNMLNMILQYAYMKETIDVIACDEMSKKGDAIFVQYGIGDVNLEEYTVIYRTDNIHGREGMNLFVRTEYADEYEELREALAQ